MVCLSTPCQWCPAIGHSSLGLLCWARILGVQGSMLVRHMCPARHEPRKYPEIIDPTSVERLREQNPGGSRRWPLLCCILQSMHKCKSSGTLLATSSSFVTVFVRPWPSSFGHGALPHTPELGICQRSALAIHDQSSLRLFCVWELVTRDSAAIGRKP